MADLSQDLELSVSTTYTWKRVKMTPPRRGPTSTAPKAPLRARLSRWNPRDSLTITVKYRGGSECWYELKARGRTYRVPGYVDLHSVMEGVYNDGRHTP